MLLVGAGLLIKSFMHLSDVSPGFNPANVLSVRVALPSTKYPQGEPRAQALRQLVERIGSVPGVQSSGAVSSLPLGGDTFNVGRGYIREGRPATPEEADGAAYLVATPDYFRTLNIPLLSGRLFTDQDTEQMPKVLVVNESMARKLWPGQSPIGKRITIWRMRNFRARSSVWSATLNHRSTMKRDNRCMCLTRRMQTGRVVTGDPHEWRTNQPDGRGAKRNSLGR